MVMMATPYTVEAISFHGIQMVTAHPDPWAVAMVN
jgi:hypothetical protein